MKRRFNYTNRVKIARKAVSIQTYNGSDGVQAFEATLDLSEYLDEFPLGARIYLEAYYRNSMMRFYMGQIGTQKESLYLAEQLTDLQDPQVNFRIKVVDEYANYGRLIGLADRIHVLNRDSDQVDRIGLLPVKFEDMGAQLWRVDIPDDGSEPMLCVNETLEAEGVLLSDLVRANPFFQGLVFPEVVRRILEHLFLNDAHDEDPESWQAKWIRFARSYAEESAPFDAEDVDKRIWIEDVVENFCSANKLKTNLEQYLQSMDR